MKYVKPDELRNLIFYAINPTIEKRREANENYFWLEFNPCATEEEIDEFIQSIPYFEEELKNFLLDDCSEMKEMLMSEERKKEFIQNVNIWSESLEWLDGDSCCIRDHALK